MKAGKVMMVVGIALVAFIGTSWAAPVDYPNKPIHIFCGWAAGSDTDSMLRSLVPTAEKILGQPIIIESKPGGSGVLALELLKQAKPDGYTLVGSSDAPLTRMPHMVNVTYDLARDFSSLILLYKQPMGVVVRSDSPFKKFQDLIEYARKNPGQLTIGIPGYGTSTHLGIVKIANLNKVKFELVPFQGSAPVTTAILGGHVMAATYTAFGFMSNVLAGNLRALMVYSDKRLKELPEVPSVGEMGYPELSNMVTGKATLIAPKALPNAAKDRLIAAFSEAIKSAPYQKMAAQSLMTVPDPPPVGKDVDKYYQTLYDMYGEAIRELGLQKK